MHAPNNTSRMPSREAAAYCGILSYYSLKRSRQTGVLLGQPAPEYLQIGSRIFYEKDTLDAWLDEYTTRRSNTAQVGD